MADSKVTGGRGGSAGAGGTGGGGTGNAPVPDEKAIARVAPVKLWIEEVGLAGKGHEAERAGYVRDLAAFCRFAGSGPKEVLESCFRKTKFGDLAISAKGRREITAQIDGYVESLGLAGRDAAVAGNRIRSFLIHNGVYMQGKVAYP